MVDTVEARIGTAVKALRRRMGITQAQLADHLGVHHAQTVSQIEKGERALKSTDLVRLAAVFHVTPLDLLSGELPTEGPFVLWRGTGDGAARADEEARFLKRCRSFAFVEERAGEPATTRLPRYPLDLATTRFEDTEGIAEDVRNALQLGDVPAPGLRANLENRWRVKVLEDVLRSGSGAATIGDFGCAVLENAQEPPSRRAFSLAHELFHLLTWEAVARHADHLSEDQERRNEQLANAFAAALLMPSRVVSVGYGARPPARLVDLVPLAQSLGVSLPALLWRLVALRRLARESVERFLDPANPWGATDPGWKPPRTVEHPVPPRFVALAYTVYMRGEISIGRLAELLETTVGMVEWRLAAFGLDLNWEGLEAEVLPA